MTTASLLNELTYNDEKPAITVLMETPLTKEIRIAMKAGQTMRDHKAPFPITVEIFEGSIEFGVDNELLTLGKGDLISLDSNVVHNLKALNNSVVRLTLSKNDDPGRVRDVVR